MSDIDPELLARSRKKFNSEFGAVATKPAEDATKAAPAKRVTVATLAKDEAVIEQARKLREEAGKRG